MSVEDAGWIGQKAAQSEKEWVVSGEKLQPQTKSQAALLEGGALETKMKVVRRQSSWPQIVLEDAESAQQVRSYQFIKRKIDRQDDVLLELDGTDGYYRHRHYDITATIRQAGKSGELPDREHSQRKIPHIGVPQIHAILDVAHNGI